MRARMSGSESTVVLLVCWLSGFLLGTPIACWHAVGPNWRTDLEGSAIVLLMAVPVGAIVAMIVALPAALLACGVGLVVREWAPALRDRRALVALGTVAGLAPGVALVVLAVGSRTDLSTCVLVGAPGAVAGAVLGVLEARQRRAWP